MIKFPNANEIQNLLKKIEKCRLLQVISIYCILDLDAKKRI